jgi:hypothetical protein
LGRIYGTKFVHFLTDKKEIKVIEDSPEVLHYRAMAKALVPKRNEQEQQEVNRLYLNWISEGTYG